MKEREVVEDNKEKEERGGFCDPQTNRHTRYKMETENTPSQHSAPARPFEHRGLGSITYIFLLL